VVEILNTELRDAQFNDESPIKTVEKIQTILNKYGIETEETWRESGVLHCHSLSLKLKGGFFSALKALAENRYSISERTMLEVSKNGKETFRALNDVVIMRVMSGHATVLDLSVDGHLPTRYTADGLIIATPTGSTAYSLSAGGPVLMNDSAGFVVTPMNPHALGIRSMVVSDKSVFSVTSCARTSGHEKTCVYVDGETAFMLEEGETAEIRKSSETAFIVSLEEHDPYAVLSKKLGWSGSSIK
jgi:NAD+ kinase